MIYLTSNIASSGGVSQADLDIVEQLAQDAYDLADSINFLNGVQQIFGEPAGTYGLGGSLMKNTNISGGGFDFTFDNVDTFDFQSNNELNLFAENILRIETDNSSFDNEITITTNTSVTNAGTDRINVSSRILDFWAFESVTFSGGNFLIENVDSFKVERGTSYFQLDAGFEASIGDTNFILSNNGLELDAGEIIRITCVDSIIQLFEENFNIIAQTFSFTGSLSGDLFSVSDTLDGVYIYAHVYEINLSASNRFIIQTLPIHANNAAAILGGMSADEVYKTATGELRIVV
jgi:hypothetical protein